MKILCGIIPLKRKVFCVVLWAQNIFRIDFQAPDILHFPFNCIQFFSWYTSAILKSQ